MRAGIDRRGAGWSGAATAAGVRERWACRVGKRGCLICSHAQRAQIDADLVHGDTLRAVGRKYGVNYVTLFSHSHHTGLNEVRERRAAAKSRRKKSKPSASAPSVDLEKPTDRESMANLYWQQYAKTWEIVMTSDGDRKQQTAALVACRAIASDMARLHGVNVETGAVNVNIDRSVTMIATQLRELTTPERRQEIRAALDALPSGDPVTIEGEAVEVVDG